MHKPIALFGNDLSFCAFCQGALHYKKGSVNKRPLVVYAALGGMILNFTRHETPSFKPLSIDTNTIRLLCEAGAAALNEGDTATMPREDQRETLRHAVEIFCTPEHPGRRTYVQAEMRPAKAFTPEKATCRKIWYEGHPDACQNFMARIDRLIIERSLSGSLARQAKKLAR